jgi:hypothetical protein
MRAKLIFLACWASLIAFYLDGVATHAVKALSGGSWTDGH